MVVFINSFKIDFIFNYYFDLIFETITPAFETNIITIIIVIIKN